MKEPKLYNPRILIVDDEQAILDEYQEILCPAEDSSEGQKLQDLGAEFFGKARTAQTSSFFDPVFCHQGDDAVEKVRTTIEQNKPFAVAFIDVRMPPGPDGVWTAEQIRALDPDIQIVIVTAYSDVDPLDISRRVQPADKLLYLQKPFHPHEIRQFASALVAKWSAEKHLAKQAAELEKSNKQLRSEIQEHKKTEENRQLLSHAVMSTNDCVYISDIDDKIIFINRAFSDTYGYQAEEIIGKDASILWKGYQPNSDEDTICQAVGGWEIGFYHRRKDNTELPVSLSRSSIKDENGNEIAFIAVARDISERILEETELRKENQILTRRNRLKNEFDVLILEDLRMSLAVLKNIICDITTVLPEKIDSRLQEDLQLAAKDITSITKVAGDFLDISRIDAGKVKLEISEFDLQPLVSKITETLSPLAANKQIKLESAIDQSLTIKADHKKIAQVLNNLIINAIELTSANGNIQIHAKDTDNKITLEVQYDGPCADANEIDKIFNRFARMKKQNSSTETFSMLTLPIAKELVQMHRGSIWAESENQQRSNFCFTLPKIKTQQQLYKTVEVG